MEYSRQGRPPVRLSKLRGQHFLTDKNIVQKIIGAAELAPNDTVLEVGPGLGVMTREILPRVGHLVAVELDPFFVHDLRAEFAEASPRKIEIVEGDILKIRTPDLLSSLFVTPTKVGVHDRSSVDPDFHRDDKRGMDYKLITNLPYNITSAFLKKFLIEPPAPEQIVVMLQKEVADRIVSHASRATSQAPTSMLGLMCNLYAECSLICKVPAAAFAPPPKVDSAVISLMPYSAEIFAAKWGIGRDFAEDIMAMAAKFFAQPRKKMCGAFGRGLRDKCQVALREIGENPDSRPAALGVGKWVELWKKLR